MCFTPAGFFQAEYTDLDGGDAFEGVAPNAKGWAERLAQWKTVGFYDLTDFKQQCKLTDDLFQITTFIPKENRGGSCSYGGPVSLNVKKNGIFIVKDVSFGPTCDHRPSLSKITINSQTHEAQNITICVFPTGKIPRDDELETADAERCFFSHESADSSNPVVLDQNRLIELIKGNGFSF